MNNDGFEEEWDADFLDQLIKVEEDALSSSNPTRSQHHNPPPPPIFQAPPLPSVASTSDVSYSPPRHLSQQFQQKPIKHYDHFSNAPAQSCSANTVSFPTHSPLFVNAKDREIDTLKRELGRVSKQLTHLEKECLDLRKERDKEEQLTSVLSRFDAKDAEVHRRKNTHINLADGTIKMSMVTPSQNAPQLPQLADSSGVHDTIQDGGVRGVHNQECPTAPLGCRGKNFTDDLAGCQINGASKTTGVQTEAVESADSIIKNDLSTNLQLSRKLLRIWDSTFHELTGRNLVSKLFVACETDFQVLFGYLSLNSSPKTTVKSLRNFSDVPMRQGKQPSHSAEAAKVSRLYSVLTKIINGLVKLEILLEALIDLCRLENAVIVYRSLRILHVVLNHLSSVKKKSDKRQNVMVEGLTSLSRSSVTHQSGFSNNEGLFHWNVTETSDAVIKPFHPEHVLKGDWERYSTLLPPTGVDWVSLFELMQQITIRNHEELVRFEAISVMNIILMRSSAYLERERYAEGVVFQNVSQLLRKESGLRVQRQAGHLVYLLLNCPKIMSMFCSGCKEEMEKAGVSISDTKRASSTQQFGKVLEGLADCLPCHGTGTQVLQLRRTAIILLAFFSSGKSGLEILLSHEFSKRTNIFALILKMLVGEMDVEALASIHPYEIFKERTLLIREALIFLNRLVSNPQYSAPVLQVLTNSRDMSFLTTDIANRLSRKGKWLWQSDTVTRNMRESEIVNLAHIFKRRVFNFLGDKISSKQN